MPKLRVLNINIEDPQEAEDTLKALPDLIKLNGI
jgi:hypothetical protein